MRKIFLAAAIIAMSMPGIALAAPAQWGIALNENANECAGYSAGDEFTHYALPSGWTSYYPENGTISTGAGTCNFEGAETCCRELNIPFVSSNIRDSRPSLIEKIFSPTGIILSAAAAVILFLAAKRLIKKKA